MEKLKEVGLLLLKAKDAKDIRKETGKLHKNTCSFL